MILGLPYEQSLDCPVAMGKRDTTKIVSEPEIIANRPGSLLSGRISNLPRKPAKRTFRAIAIGILLGNIAQMPNLIKGNRLPAAKIIVVHEI